jgi:hypothetical protein
MALKSYLIDDNLLRMYMSPKHEVKKDGKTVMYRLIQGDSELELKKQPENAETRTIYFGQKIFTTDDVTEQQFIESKPYYGTKIKHYDPLANSKKELEEQTNSINLLGEVSSMEDDKIRQVGYVLFGREALQYLKEGNFAGLKGKILKEAALNPEAVSGVINDKSNADALFAGMLIASEIFNVSVDEREVTWGDNGSRIYAVPNGVSALEGLVEYFKTAEGREVKKEASLRVEKKAGENASKKVEVDEDNSEYTTETPARRGRPAVNK